MADLHVYGFCVAQLYHMLTKDTPQMLSEYGSGVTVEDIRRPLIHMLDSFRFCCMIQAGPHAFLDMNSVEELDLSYRPPAPTASDAAGTYKFLRVVQDLDVDMVIPATFQQASNARFFQFYGPHVQRCLNRWGLPAYTWAIRIYIRQNHQARIFDPKRCRGTEFSARLLRANYERYRNPINGQPKRPHVVGRKLGNTVNLTWPVRATIINQNRFQYWMSDGDFGDNLDTVPCMIEYFGKFLQRLKVDSSKFGSGTHVKYLENHLRKEDSEPGWEQAEEFFLFQEFSYVPANFQVTSVKNPPSDEKEWGNFWLFKMKPEIADQEMDLVLMKINPHAKKNKRFRPGTTYFRQIILLDYLDSIFTEWQWEDPTNANTLSYWNYAVWLLTCGTGQALDLSETEIASVYVRQLFHPREAKELADIVTLACFLNGGMGETRVRFPTHRELVHTWYRLALDPTLINQEEFQQIRQHRGLQFMINKCYQDAMEEFGMDPAVWKKTCTGDALLEPSQEYLQSIQQTLEPYPGVTQEVLNQIHRILEEIVHYPLDGTALKQELKTWDIHQLYTNIQFTQVEERLNQFKLKREQPICRVSDIVGGGGTRGLTQSVASQSSKRANPVRTGLSSGMVSESMEWLAPRKLYEVKNHHPGMRRGDRAKTHQGIQGEVRGILVQARYAGMEQFVWPKIDPLPGDFMIPQED
ncbi:MAG: hypothetical protein GY679_04300, partial [Mycoplasma sp.]|nr:hypothetical protein [Mycoplasma sp.]